MSYDCVVIGAGVSGLASSIILSRNGFKTALIEKSAKTGPLLRGFRRNGYYFDTGFHHAGGIGEGSSGEVMLNYLGVLDNLNILTYERDHFDAVKFLDSSFQFKFPTGFGRIRSSLHEAFPNDKHAIDKYMGEIKRRLEMLPYLNLDAEFDPTMILANVHSPSLKEFLSEHTDNEILKSVIAVHCLLNGVPPHEQALSNYAHIAGPYYESVSYFKGGGTSIINALEKQAKQKGVDIFLSKNASKILFSPAGDLRGVEFNDGSSIDCRNCISTIHPLSFLEITSGAHFREPYIKRLKSLDETLSAFILYCVSEVDLSSVLAPSLYLLPADWIEDFNSGKSLEKRPFNLVSIEGERSNESTGFAFIALCPASKKETAPWADSFLGKRPPQYKAYKENITEQMLKHIQFSCPELNGKVKVLDCSTPLTLRDYSNSPFGSMYGVKHKIDQFNPFPVTRIPGLYLAGQSIVAPGLLGTLISAFLACGNILGHDFLRGELKKWV